MKHVRELGEKDRKAQLELICEGFPWNTPEAMKERFDLLAAHSDSFGSFEDDVLASQIISTPYTIDFYGTKYPMAGIGFVATSHSYQHQHRIDDLMSCILKSCIRTVRSFRILRRFRIASTAASAMKQFSICLISRSCARIFLPTATLFF